MLPCPMCSAVIRNGVHRRECSVVPAWMYARHTSEKSGINHFVWTGCVHASPIGPVEPSVERLLTEEKWAKEARRLLELKTANWKLEVRDEFARILGFIAPPAEELLLEPQPEPQKP